MRHVQVGGGGGDDDDEEDLDDMAQGELISATSTGRSENPAGAATGKPAGGGAGQPGKPLHSGDGGAQGMARSRTPPVPTAPGAS
eukprot:56681-Chlamydomonas_euryale.AAC.1